MMPKFFYQILLIMSLIFISSAMQSQDSSLDKILQKCDEIYEEKSSELAYQFVEGYLEYKKDIISKKDWDVRQEELKRELRDLAVFTEKSKQMAEEKYKTLQQQIQQRIEKISR